MTCLSKASRRGHVKNLRIIIERLLAYGMRLNPDNCVTISKFLGYVVSNRGIEANPLKVQAILNMKAPVKKKGNPLLTTQALLTLVIWPKSRVMGLVRAFRIVKS